jgi:hypothetical protein
MISIKNTLFNEGTVYENERSGKHESSGKYYEFLENERSEEERY